MKKKNVGGQAVIEGVMMRGAKGMATAVRKENGEIALKFQNVIPLTKKYKILNIPFIRGIFILVDSLKIGMDSLNFSASFFEEEEESKFDKWLKGKLGDKADGLIMTLTMGVAFLLAIGLFIGVPTLLASLFKGVITSPIVLNLIEAVLRITILFLYITGISKIEEMYRVFQYHGAEHKAIFCYEAEEPLTVENVKKFERFHPRCGTNFLFLIMFVSIFVFSFTGWGGVLQRIITRIVLIPIVSGITYEIIKWLGSSEGKLAKIISYPGLQLQRLTTKEPDDKQIEVAIKSLMAAEGIEEEEETIGEILKDGIGILAESKIDNPNLDGKLLLSHVLKKDKLYILTNPDVKVENTKKEEYFKLINKRKDNMPVKYILGECEFFGISFYVEEGVLIPRGDTEILVEETLKYISEEEEINLLDLCCGSGAIGIALAKNRENIKVDLVDLYPIPEKVTKKNITRNNLNERVEFIKSNLLDELVKREKGYDVIVSNPPYIKDEEIETLMKDVKDYEPKTALSGGESGLDFYIKIIKDSKKLLKNKGLLCFEIGYDQGEAVSNLMKDEGYEDVYVVKDLASLDRVVVGRFPC